MSWNWSGYNTLEEAQRNIETRGDFEFLFPIYDEKVKPFLNEHNMGLALDFGCGVGRFIKWLYNSGVKKIVGYDFPNMIELAKQYLPIEQYELTDWLPIGETEKLRERQFDLIHSSLVLQHISASEADNAVNLFADIIAPRGLLVMWSRSSMDLAAGTVWDYVLKRFGPISRFDKSAADKDPNDHQLVLFRKYQ